MSESTKKKISKAKKGRKLSDEHKRKIGEGVLRTGHVYTEEEKKKMSINFKKNYKKENHPCWGNTSEEHPTAKLTQRQADEIRKKYVPHKYTQPMLAKEYGVCVMTISSIVYNKTYIRGKSDVKR